MTFPTDWDIDQYRVEHECEDHWELRRSFLEAHKDKFPEDRLVCLAQVFYNVEFMGCRYPEKTMRLVAQLSQGIADEHREKTKTKLQRTFVQASDAASTKAKGHNSFGTAHSKKNFINFCKSTEENDNSVTIDNNSPNNSNQDTLPNPQEEESEAFHAEQLPKAKKIKTETKNKKKIVTKSQQNLEEKMVEGTADKATTAKKIKKRKKNSPNNCNQDMLPNPHEEESEAFHSEQLPKAKKIKTETKKKKKIVTKSQQNLEEKMVEGTADKATTAKKIKKRKKKVIGNGAVTIVNNSTIEAPQDGDNEPEETPQDSDVLPEENVQDAKTVQHPQAKKKRSKKEPQAVEGTAVAEIPPDSDAFPNKQNIDNELSRFVLMKSEDANEPPYNILARSAAQNQSHLRQIVVRTPAGREMTLTLNGCFLARATGLSETEARKNCALQALETLKKSCYTLIIKDRFAGSLVEKDTDVTGAPSTTPQEVPTHLAEDSKVSRMMKLMGWGGGGLGKNQQGREKPVEVEQRVRRVGLGVATQGGAGLTFKQSIDKMLKKYRSTPSFHDLVFTSDYSKEERAYIHSVARKINLRSLSYGKDPNRRLVVSQYRSPGQLVQQLLKTGDTSKYDVIPPRNL